jgi:FAD/FMN-containing dehydrogenase
MPPSPPAAVSVSGALHAALRRRVEGDVDFGAGARALYATDASNYRQPPIGVVIPRTIDDVIETVRICREYGAPIPRGAGTSLAGQCCNTAIVIDLSRHLNDILSIDADRKTARVPPGIVLDDLQRAVRPFGLMYGPDPATHAWCTLGGMIGNNSCGVHSGRRGPSSSRRCSATGWSTPSASSRASGIPRD